RQRADEDGVLQGPRRQPLPDRLEAARAGVVIGSSTRPASGAGGHRRLRGDLAAPFDDVAVLAGELLDLGLGLGDLDPRGLAVRPAPGPFPGDFLAEPLAAVVVNDQALHPQFSAGFTDSPVSMVRHGEAIAKPGSQPLMTPTGRSRATFLEMPTLST